ncbi:hypothetical protein PS6_001397 [Mucor atramentarius]
MPYFTRAKWEYWNLSNAVQGKMNANKLLSVDQAFDSVRRDLNMNNEKEAEHWKARSIMNCIQNVSSFYNILAMNLQSHHQMSTLKQ